MKPDLRDSSRFEWVAGYRYLAVLILLGLQLLSPFAHGASSVLDASQLDPMPVSLTEYFEILEDPERKLSLEDVKKPAVAARFKAVLSSDAALNYGYTPAAYWLRLRLQNDSDRPLERMLEIGYALLSDVQFHQPSTDGSYQSIVTGNKQPFASRALKNRFFVFPLTLPARSEQVYYLRIQSTDAVIIPARLWAPKAFHAYERNDYLGQALYFGLAIAMLIFNLLLFIALGDLIYLLYVCFVACSAVAIGAQNGLAQEFLWPDSPLLADIGHFVGYSLSIAAFLPFMRLMLNTAKVMPRLDRQFKYLALFFLLTPIALVTSLQAFAKYAALSNLLAGVVVLSVGLFCIYKRQRSAYFFVAAFAMMVVGGVMTVLRGQGVLPSNILTIYGLQFGSALEMLLLAFALADLVNQTRREKAKAQREALEAQQRLVEGLKSSERLLEARVALRTDELQVMNRKLEALSATDGLTGVANRRRFDEMLESEWRRASRVGLPLAVGMLDVDWFKKYNDHYGHQGGDECLRTIARVLAGSVSRTSDLVARYGGEEFVFLAPATTGESALAIAQKICQALEAMALPHQLSAFGRVTASIGVCAMIPAKDGTADLLVKAADEALYQAKAQGRNQAVLAGSS